MRPWLNTTCINVWAYSSNEYSVDSLSDGRGLPTSRLQLLGGGGINELMTATKVCSLLQSVSGQLINTRYELIIVKQNYA